MDLPGDVDRRLVLAVGTFLREMPPAEIPAPLRRFQGFRPKALLGHSAKLVGALDDEGLRAKILDWLSAGRTPLGEDDTALLEIAARREDGWEEELAALGSGEPGDRGGPDEAERLRASLERERDKTKRAREELRKERERSATETAALGARLAELEKRASDGASAAAEAAADAARERSDADKRRADADRAIRKANRVAEKAAADAKAANKEAAAARRELSLVQKELDATRVELENANRRVEELQRRVAVPASGTKPKRRRKRKPLGVPPGRLPTDPQTLDHWLDAEGVSLLIDGYNVTMAEGGFSELELERQRDRLITEIGHLATRHSVSTTIVFDGRSFEGKTPRRPDKGYLSVRYSKGEIADDTLVKLVAGGAPEPVIVVTSDRALQERVEAHGANVATSPQLLALIR